MILHIIILTHFKMSTDRNKTDNGTLLLDLQKELISKENVNGIIFNKFK